MYYVSDTARTRICNLFRLKCALIPLGHSDNSILSFELVELLISFQISFQIQFRGGQVKKLINILDWYLLPISNHKLDPECFHKFSYRAMKIPDIFIYVAWLGSRVGSFHLLNNFQVIFYKHQFGRIIWRERERKTFEKVN